MADGPERPAPPPDAFYYGKSPTGNGFPHRPSSLSGSADLLRELKNKENEIDAVHKREATLRVIIGKAVQQGFVSDEIQDMPTGEELGSNEVVRKLADALVKLKQDKANIQVGKLAKTCADHTERTC